MLPEKVKQRFLEATTAILQESNQEQAYIWFEITSSYCGTSDRKNYIQHAMKKQVMHLLALTMV